MAFKTMLYNIASGRRLGRKHLGQAGGGQVSRRTQVGYLDDR